MDLAELSQIVDRINIDLHNCNEALETLRPIFFSPAPILEKFNNNYSANVLTYLQRALHQDAILSISRMWDPNTDAHSIPRVMHELTSADIVGEIKARRSEAKLAMLKLTEMEKLARVDGDKEAIERNAHEDAKNAAAAVDDDIAEVQSMCNEPALRELVDRNLNWRHKNVAHALEITHMERKAKRAGVEIVNPKWGEVFDLKTQTNTIVSRLMVLVADTSIFPEDSENIFAQYAQAFWGSFIEEPR